MRLTTGISSGKAAYYDRNPLTIQAMAADNAALAPHALTTRWTYTVPAARKAIVTSIQVRTRVVTVSAPVGAVTVTITLGSTINPVSLRNTLNTVDAIDQAILGSGIILQSGEVLKLGDSDASTGGTRDFEELATATEFDA